MEWLIFADGFVGGNAATQKIEITVIVSVVVVLRMVIIFKTSNLPRIPLYIYRYSVLIPDLNPIGTWRHIGLIIAINILPLNNVSNLNNYVVG